MNEKSYIFRKIVEDISSLSKSYRKLEAAPRHFGTDDLLHYVEVHIVEAIGNSGKISVSELARKLNVTKGAVSQKVSKLLNSRILNKIPDSNDQRAFSLILTTKGKIIFEEHNKFHDDFLNRFIEKNGKASCNELIGFEKTLSQMKKTIEELT